jgi:predicted nucleotidyltransferase
MDINAAFDTLQSTVNAPIEAVLRARERRNLFRTAFEPEDDVAEVFPSGSFARGSQRDPIHDVDMVIIYHQASHPDWGSPGPSAGDALDHVQGRVRVLLGVTEGTVAKEVRLATPRNHSVKCFLDDPEDENAFTVDAMPALRQEDGTLLIPEKNSTCWVPADPEDLIDRVAMRHAEWNRFVGLVRILKRWADDRNTNIKSLVIEVLALDNLPEETRPKALARFFTAAANAVWQPVCDPAGLCGEIQPDLDRAAAAAHFEQAAEEAWRAVSAQDRDDTDEAACHWRKVFGPIFPEPEGGCGGGNGKLAAFGVIAATPKRRPVKNAPQGAR